MVSRSLAPLAALGALLAAAAVLPQPARADAPLALPEMMRTAESAALGNAGAFLRGVSAVGVNPAGAQVTRPEVAAQYQQLPEQASLTLFGTAVPIRALDGTTLGLNYLSFRSVGFDGRDEYGQQQGSFNDVEDLLAVTVAQPILQDESDNGLALGGTFKYMRLQIAGYTAQAPALDLGARWSLRSFPVSFGVSALNLGRGPQFVGERSRLPTSYSLSSSVHIAKSAALNVSLDRRLADGRLDLSVGTQYVLGGFLALRARYGASPNGESTIGFGNLTGGFGLSMFDGKTLDYSFQPYAAALRQAGDLGVHRITLTLRFGSSQAKPRARDPWAERRDEYLIGTW